jgi:hypothetical protein
MGNVINMGTPKKLRSLEAIAREVVALAVELDEASHDDTDASAHAALSDLASLLKFVAFRLDVLAPVEEDPRAAELRALCLCGHDKGEHLSEAPHTCEGVAFVEGMRASFGAVLGDWPDCPCVGFEAEDAHTFFDIETQRTVRP